MPAQDLKTVPEAAKAAVEEVKEVTVKVGSAILFLAVLLIFGTAAFHVLETYPDGPMEGQNWSYVDSFYFSAMTLTTIGYGDLSPTHDLSKLVTVFYAFFGVALVLYLLGVIAKWYIERSVRFEEHEIRRIKNILHRHETQTKKGQGKP
ncbi:MAG: potassium channel family protein [archaeon]|jgi:hypothetical protein|nr:potassium channel family protein [archaeon]